MPTLIDPQLAQVSSLCRRYGVRKLELYCGTVEISDKGADVKALRLPVAEKNLGKKNNLVAEGGTYPSVLQF